MTPAVYNITLVQGSMFRLPIVVKAAGAPVDITGWQANMQVRKAPGKPLLVEARTEGGTGGTIAIVGDPADGRFEVYIPASAMESVPPGRWRWDLELVPASGAEDTQQYVAGVATVLPQVTVI